MNLKSLNIKSFSLILLLTVGGSSYSQKTSYTYVGFRTEPFFHSPNKNDQALFDTAAYLINSEPTTLNYKTYYLLASALWNLKNIDDAKKMFIKIVKSRESYYEDTYYHSSDVPGDTTKSTYGYGNYTANYKNRASTYLTQIYIEQKKYDSAYSYLNEAVNKYKVHYTCGTGYYLQQASYRNLYGLCYEGLGKESELFELLLPYCFNWGENETLIRVIKRKYSKTEMRKHLRDAIHSIQIKIDKEQSSVFFTSNNGQENEKTREIKYYGGTATVTLFGKVVNLPSPGIENERPLTKQDFIKVFKGSDFYDRLYNPE
jgi:tetratricopeptide (TPR) repeat protein